MRLKTITWIETVADIIAILCIFYLMQEPIGLVDKLIIAFIWILTMVSTWLTWQRSKKIKIQITARIVDILKK